MDNPSNGTSPKDAHDVPEWANWPLKPDGKLDTERLMPTTFLVCSKEYSKSRQDLVKSLPSFAPKRDRLTKSVPVISNLTLLELYDLAGEEIREFRAYVLETIHEPDRINNTETLMNDHESIRRSMSELRKVANEIHEKKSREDCAVFLNKRANLAILGYFTRQDPRNQNVHLPLRPMRQFKEFMCGNKGAARVSVYNWRHKLWGASVYRNLSMTPDRIAVTQRNIGAIRRVVATKSPLKMPKLEANEDPFPFDTVEGNDEVPGSSHAESQSMAREASSVSPPEAKKMKMESGFNIKNAIGKGREEVNFYCAVNANKVNPEEFGLPKGFIKYGDQIVHHSRKERVDKSERKRRRIVRKKKEESKGEDKKEAATSDGPVEGSAKDNEKGNQQNLNDSKGSEVILEDIEEDDEMESDEEIDVSNDESIVISIESSTQTDISDDVVRTENGINLELAKHLEKLESIHCEDMGIIQKLKVENGLAVRNLSKYHNKYVTLMMDRNNLKCTYNVVDKERKAEKIANSQLTKTVKHLTQQNTLLLNEVNALKREIAIRDQMEFASREVGRYEEFAG